MLDLWRFVWTYAHAWRSAEEREIIFQVAKIFTISWKYSKIKKHRDFRNFLVRPWIILLDSYSYIYIRMPFENWSINIWSAWRELHSYRIFCVLLICYQNFVFDSIFRIQCQQIILIIIKNTKNLILLIVDLNNTVKY